MHNDCLAVPSQAVFLPSPFMDALTRRNCLARKAIKNSQGATGIYLPKYLLISFLFVIFVAK